MLDPKQTLNWIDWLIDKLWRIQRTLHLQSICASDFVQAPLLWACLHLLQTKLSDLDASSRQAHISSHLGRIYRLFMHTLWAMPTRTQLQKKRWFMRRHFQGISKSACNRLLNVRAFWTKTVSALQWRIIRKALCVCVQLQQWRVHNKVLVVVAEETRTIRSWEVTGKPALLLGGRLPKHWYRQIILKAQCKHTHQRQNACIFRSAPTNSTGILDIWWILYIPT